MEGLEGYSDTQKQIIETIVERDNKFHKNVFVSDAPFSGIFQDNDDGTTTVSGSILAEVSNSDINISIRIWRSEESKLWFFYVQTGNDEIRGILHFNTIYNARGEISFAFLSDSNSDDFDGINTALGYSNFLLMRK